MSRSPSDPQTGGTRLNPAAARPGQQANTPEDSTPLHIIRKIYGTPRRPVFSSRRITPKDADYEKQMLGEIDNEFRLMSYDEFMNCYVPRSGTELDSKKMREASPILADGLNVEFAKKAIPEAYMYPILVRIVYTQRGRKHLLIFCSVQSL
jgi:hypothetical protein